MKTVGNKFLNAVEISAQEAVYVCLQLHMKKSSRHVTFVNTSPPEQRVTLLKPRHLLDAMHEEDEEIECGNLLTRYAQRPGSMDSVTLAEFASYFVETRQKYTPRSNKIAQRSHDSLLPESNNCENDDALENKEEDTENMPRTSNDQPEIASKCYRKRKHGHIIRPVHFNPDVDLELYYRELIMLYYPWKNEDNLMGSCSSYEDRFVELEEHINLHRKQFEPFAKEVDEAERVLAADPDLEDNWDELAPCAEHENRKDKQKVVTNTDTGIEDYNIAGDLGLPIAVSEDDIHDFNEMPDQQYREHMRRLNNEQLQFVCDTVHHIKTSSEPLYRFLSGGAGVGKSFVIQALYQTVLKFLNKHAGDDFNKRRILLLAPTGKAAYHIKGSTIHNGLKITPSNKLEHRPLSASQLNTLRNQISSVKLLIIDEVSMVGFRMFNCINQRLMEVMQCAKPFGGISVITVGDLFQLEPVFDTYVFQQPRSGFMPLATNIWLEHFHMFELQTIMRQADSRQFAQLLNRLREGHQTQQDLEILQQRIVHRGSSTYPYDTTHLMHKNVDVNSYNSQVIAMSQKKIYTVTAKDRIVGSTPQHMQQKILNSFQNSHAKTCQLANELSVCEGIYYDLTVNLDTADGLTNGASCQVTKIDIQEHEKYACGTVWVQFQDKSTGRTLRAANKHLYKRGYSKDWTPIQPMVKQYAAGQKGQAQVQRFQFPLRPAHAKSIHRSQGDTLERAVLDLTTSRRINHIHYVAISRLKTLDGLFIINLQEDKISIDKNVQAEMTRLRQTPLTFQHRLLPEIPLDFKLVFLNASSLHKHLPDLRCDPSVKTADIVCACETRFDKQDSIQNTSLEHFHQHRQDSKQVSDTRPPHGLVLYTKSRCVYGPYSESRAGVEILVFRVEKQSDVLMVFLYKPPKVPTSTLIDLLKVVQEKHISSSSAILYGDFNIDWNTHSYDKTALANFMSKWKYHQAIFGATNNFGSTIDLIFTNLPTPASGVIETYYSDHKLCWIGW